MHMIPQSSPFFSLGQSVFICKMNQLDQLSPDPAALTHTAPWVCPVTGFVGPARTHGKSYAESTSEAGQHRTIKLLSRRGAVKTGERFRGGVWSLAGMQ